MRESLQSDLFLQLLLEVLQTNQYSKNVYEKHQFFRFIYHCFSKHHLNNVHVFKLLLQRTVTLQCLLLFQSL